MDLVLFGIQGSGKGTQAKQLCAEFGYAYFEAGGELRKIKASGSELGKTVASYIDVGKLVPHEIIMQVCEGAIRAIDPGKVILFDGIPRDIDQMRDFDRIMKALGRDFRCIEITLGPEAAVQRILGRAKIEGRKDDADEATIRKRMSLFTQMTRPVIETYRKHGKVTNINGGRPVEEVYEALKKLVSS